MKNNLFSLILCGALFAPLMMEYAIGQTVEINAVALQNGAVLRSYTSEYGSRQSANWIALGLIDENPNIGWSSAKLKSTDNEFVFELATSYAALFLII